MKKLLLIGLALLAAAAAHAQGEICLDNVGNTNTSVTATRDGLFFLNGGSGPHPINQDFNVAFYGGIDSANLTLIRSFSGAAAAGDNAAGPGTFIDPTGICAAIPGTTNMDVAFFRIQAWTGNFASFDAALLGGGLVGQSPVFANPVAGPPYAPPDFTEMPAICIGIIECIPEPSTSALAGLAAALLVFRWRPR